MDSLFSLFSPFIDYAFMKRALAACLILSLSGTLLGVFITLRKMTLIGDAVSHSILPGIAIAFFLFGFAVVPMAIGGMSAGIIVALLAVLLIRFSSLKADSAITLIYLLSLSFGVILISISETNIDLSHFLIGDILSVDNDSLILMSSIAVITVFSLAVFYRSFIIQSFDETQRNTKIEIVFYSLLIMNLISSFFVFGILMGLAIILIPAIAARCLSKNIDTILLLSIIIAMIGSFSGLILSYCFDIPSGSAIVLILGIICFASVGSEIFLKRRNISC